MSGTVPPPPPPPGGPEPRDVPEPGEPRTPFDAPRDSAPSLPPSFSPSNPPSGAPTRVSRLGEVPLQRVAAPWAPETTSSVPPAPSVHEPIPPAPERDSASTGPLWTAQPEPDPWATQPGASGQQTTVQPPLPPRPASFQPDSAARPPAPIPPSAQQQFQQQEFQQQPSYAPPPDEQPTAPQPAVQQPVQQPGTSDWWGGQWSTPSPQPAPSYPPAPPAYTQPQQAYGQASQGYDPGYAQGVGQSYGQPYDQGYAGDYGAPAPAYAGTPAPPPPPGSAKRRRLTPGWIAFIAVDALLIVVAIIFAIQIFGGPPLHTDDAGAEGAGSQATTEASPSPEEEAASDEPLARFASPSRNITCSIFDDSVTCGIAQLDQQPAPMEGCSGTAGYVVTIAGADGKVSLPCVEASDQPKKAGKKLKVLKYGKSITEGDFTCSSDENGMQCRHDPTGSGFSLARAGIGTF